MNLRRWPTPIQKRKTFRRIDYSPFPIQATIHNSAAKILQIVGAEGGGKSHVTAAEICANMPWCKLVYLVGQTYDNTHQEFNYLVEHFMTLNAFELDNNNQIKQGIVSQPKQGAWSMTTRTGCHIVTLSVERGASSIIAKGEQPDIITLCEAGVISSYGVFLSAVRRARRARGRVILVGTLKDNFGWYASLVDELSVPGNAWQGETFSLPAWANLALYPGGRDDPEIVYLEKTMPAEEFARTVAAKKVQSKALVFPEAEFKTHFRDCPYDPDLPVYIWIDPGYHPSAYAVAAVQFRESERGDTEVWQVDEIYLNFHTHKQVIQIAQDRKWWKNVREGVIDVAGRAHHATDSAVETWETEAGIRIHSSQVGIDDGIARHRDFLGGGDIPPRLFHDAEKCIKTAWEYGHYKKPTDLDGNPTSDKPVDKNNHLMKAIAYGLVWYFGLSDRSREAVSGVVQRAKQLQIEIETGGWA